MSKQIWVEVEMAMGGGESFLYHLIFASKAYIPNFGPAGPPHPFEKFLVVVQNKFYAKKNFQKKFEEEIKKSEGLTYWGGR